MHVWHVTARSVSPYQACAVAVIKLVKASFVRTSLRRIHLSLEKVAEAILSNRSPALWRSFEPVRKKTASRCLKASPTSSGLALPPFLPVLEASFSLSNASVPATQAPSAASQPSKPPASPPHMPRARPSERRPPRRHRRAPRSWPGPE